MVDYRRNRYCKKCGKAFKEGDGGYRVKIGGVPWDMHEDMCSNCAKETYFENKTKCENCGRYVDDAKECPVCNKPLCRFCGKLFPYYGYEVFVCSDKCYNKLMKEHFRGLYPDREF